MKITYFAHSVLNRGGDKMVLAHLAHLAESGHKVEIKTNKIETVFDVHPAIKIIKLRFKSKFGSILSAIAEKQHSDCIIATIIPMACFLSLRNRGNVLYFAQDYNENIYENIFMKLLVRQLYFFGLIIKKIPVFAVSHDLADIFRNNYRTSCPVICNGVNHKVFYPDPSEVLLKSKNDNKTILFFSRNDRRKGFDLALEVAKKVVKISEKPVEIWTVGEEIDLGESIPCRNFGYVAEDELRKIFGSADVFLYPSRSEGFPLMVMESFACKCPVVTTEAVSYAEHGINALVGKIGDIEQLTAHVLALFKDGALVEKITSGGLSFAEEHSLGRSCALFENALCNINYNT